MSLIENISEEYAKSAEPSSVLYGPVNVALNVDPVDASRTFINTLEFLQNLGILANNETSSPRADTTLKL